MAHFLWRRLYTVLDCNKSEPLGDKLEGNWALELAKAKAKNQQPKLLKVIVKTFIWRYMIYGGILFIQHVLLRSLQPVVLSYLISLFKESSTPDRSAMYISASVLVIISISVVFSMHHTNYGQASIGMRIRIALSSLIYRKTLKLNKKSLNQTAIGQVVNLLSNDVNRFDLVVWTLHYLWILPFQVSVITYLLWWQVGVSSFAGVFSIALLSLPVQGYLGKLTSNFRLKVAQKTDFRVTLMSEIISGIQVIKMYAWEKPFEIFVKKARAKEVDALTATSYLRGIYLSFMIFVERTALFLTLTCHVLMGNAIVAEQVFSLAQFFSLLQLTMSVFYPMSISYGAEALVAINRIQTFLMLEEVEESQVVTDFQEGVSFVNVQAGWVPNQLVVKDMSFNVQPGQLCVIIGAVGAGKSSILQLLLGELTPECGRIAVQGTMSYASQEPWLFASTIRNNILFGESYDKSRYNKVVKVCALQKDFDQFPLADKTLAGERGTALSGGQRARVNLARAVYREADVYLFDDPLSAVDTQVGKHLFEECIVKYLKNKTRILLTHQLQYLPKADLIILLNEGRIEAQGTYEEILSSNLNFTKDMVSEEEESVANPKASLLLSSSLGVDSIDQADNNDDHEEESGNKDNAPLSEYIKSSGNYCQISIVLFMLIACQVFCSGVDYWVTFWTQQEESRNTTINETVPVEEIIEYYPSDEQEFDGYFYTITKKKNITMQILGNTPNLLNTNMAIYIYTALIVALIVVTLLRSILYFNLAMNASRNLHKKMFTTLLEAPMRFFNTNPTGRILNRFSKDMGSIDEILPKVLLESLQIMLIMAGILVMVIISNFYMTVAVVLLGIIFIKVRYWFIKTAKEIKHLEGITKSPVFSHLNSSLNGMTTIRAFGVEDILKREFDDHQDVHTSAWFLTIMSMVSFGLWLDLICVIFIACTCGSFIILNQYGAVSGSLVGLAISQSLILTGMLQYGIRQTAEVVNQLTSVERILEYTDLEKEGPFETPSENLPKEPWPKNGMMEIRDLSLQYGPNDPPVLKNINVTIKAGQKIGIVGRTGAGKSSLISAIFRLVEIEGNILIDEVDVKTLGLYHLRKKISIIPQEPVLFSSTLRNNLDPFSEFTDEKLWTALEEVELKDIVDNLDSIVSGGGGNFSVGQRQLLCLARAILRNNKILILDEATANIDPKTDALIQKTIRKKFKSCTVLTVAHRLNTIMDSDRVMVMDHGELKEFDFPYSLLQNPDTIFHRMVVETGLSMSSYLEDIALDAFIHRRSSDDC